MSIPEEKMIGVPAYKEGESQEIAPVSAPAKWDMEADLVIVGGGGSGLCAASAGLKNGASVIVLEKQAKTGGHSQHGGAAAAFNTNQAKRRHLNANPKKAFKHSYTIQSNATVNPRLLMTLIDRSHEVYDWSETQNWGQGWDAMTLGFIPDQGIARMIIKGTLKSGAFISGTEFLGMNYPWMKWLNEDVTKKGGNILINTEVKTLVKENGRVLGVKAQTADGRTLFVKGKKAVILAGGSFTNNPAMIKKYCPDIAKKAVGSMAPPCDTGEPIRMALGAGADLAGVNSWVAFAGGIPFYDTQYTGKDKPGPWSQYLRQGWLQLTRGGGWLEVNQACEEFLPDVAHADYEMHPRAMASTGGHSAYVFFDDNFRTSIWETLPPPMLDDRPMTVDDPQYTWFDEFKEFQPKNWLESVDYAIELGGIKKCNTIEELAKEMGLDPKRLEAAIQKWNEKAKAKKVDEFGRLPQNMKPIFKAPFYGIKTGAIIAGIFCGPRVNHKFEVLDTEQKIIPGLYAAGLNAGGTNGEGAFQASVLSNLGLAYATGWIAGDNATNPHPTYEPKNMILESEVGAQVLLGKVNRYFPAIGNFMMKMAFAINKRKE